MKCFLQKMPAVVKSARGVTVEHARAAEGEDSHCTLEMVTHCAVEVNVISEPAAGPWRPRLDDFAPSYARRLCELLS